VRVLGGLENMSGLACPHCGERVDVFPSVAPGRSIWPQGLERLAEIPLEPSLAEPGARAPRRGATSLSSRRACRAA
jgi:Mrp family chromosome partitioning ATPase